jgi:hypothetical protein
VPRERWQSYGKAKGLVSSAERALKFLPFDVQNVDSFSYGLNLIRLPEISSQEDGADACVPYH